MIERREFLKSLLVVIALPLTTTLKIPTKDSVDIPVDETDDVWDGIKIKYLGKVEAWDYNYTGRVYTVYRYHLTKQTHNTCEGETLHAYCDIDADLCDIAAEYKAGYIRSELRMTAEAMQMECKHKSKYYEQIP